MKYVLMRHEHEGKIERAYREIGNMNNNLSKSEIIDRVASVLAETYGFIESIEYAKLMEAEREEFRKKAEKEGIRISSKPEINRLLQSAKKIKELSTEYPTHVIAYNDCLRTEATAKAVFNISQGELLKADLHEGAKVWDFMQDRKANEGLCVIVTHQPDIYAILGVSAKESDAFLAEELYGRYATTEWLNPEERF